MSIPGYRRLFGGQLLAQALVAAGAGRVPAGAGGPPEMTARSIHIVFVAEGRPHEPVVWAVEAVHDGRSFATRIVRASQGARPLAVAVVSMHADEAGLEHQSAPPDCGPPEGLLPLAPAGAMPLEMRVAGDVALDGSDFGPAELAVFMRPRRPLASDDPLSHQALLAYCSDATMMAVAMRPHPGVGFGSAALAATAVTSHTVSFHRPFRVEGFMLFAQQSPVAAGARAYTRGDWFDAAGSLVASCAQESVIRTGGR